VALAGATGCGGGAGQTGPKGHVIEIDIDDHGLAGLWMANAPNLKGLIANAVTRQQPSTRPVEQISDVTTTKAPAPMPMMADPFGDDAPRTTQRTVKVIRNGVESSVIFDVPRPTKSREVLIETPGGTALDPANGK